jgi:hypothetical protein
VVNYRKPRGLGADSMPIPPMTWSPRLSRIGLVLWSKPTKPHVQTPVVSCYPAPAHVHDFALLFLPPCGSHLISFSHRVHRAKPTCLFTPQKLYKLRPFMPPLHLHHRKSSHNLHLQYSAKSQSTPRCQSLIPPRSDHPLVLRRSGPQ